MSESNKQSNPSSMVEIKYKKISFRDLEFDQGDTVGSHGCVIACLIVYM